MKNKNRCDVAKRIAVMTTARNDSFFLERWLRYYGENLGYENLFVILDGHDQARPDNSEKVNVVYLPRVPLGRAPAMRRRARIMSDFARGLHRIFDIVIVTDCDEFLVLDPNHGGTLAEYLSQIKGVSSVSGLGLDVAQNTHEEAPLDTKAPLLGQRRFAHVSARYTKPATSFRPITWGSGMHRIKGHNFHIDPNLYHFHFGMVDYARATEKTTDQDRLKTGWKNHLKRREKLFDIIRNSEALEGDDYFDTARKLQTYSRPLYAINKPGMIKGNPTVTIPERFWGLV